MTNANADFFLGSREHRDEWREVRSCNVVGKVTDSEGHEYLWVKVDPPVPGQKYGLHDRNLSDVFLLPHFEGTSLFPVSQFPLPVYIYRPLDDAVFSQSRPAASDFKMAAWGEIYTTREAAEGSE